MNHRSGIIARIVEKNGFCNHCMQSLSERLRSKIKVNILVCRSGSAFIHEGGSDGTNTGVSDRDRVG